MLSYTHQLWACLKGFKTTSLDSCINMFNLKIVPLTFLQTHKMLNLQVLSSGTIWLAKITSAEMFYFTSRTSQFDWAPCYNLINKTENVNRLLYNALQKSFNDTDIKMNKEIQLGIKANLFTVQKFYGEQLHVWNSKTKVNDATCWKNTSQRLTSDSSPSVINSR